MPEPSPGKSIVFFACEAYETKLGLDGTWVAANRYASYSYVDVEPGVRRFCGVEPRPSGYKESLLLLTAEEGNTYYLVWRKGKLSEISKLEWEALMDKWIRARLRWKKAAKNSGAYVTFERLPADRSK